MDSWVTLPENIFSLKFMVFRSGLACQAVMTGVEGIRVRGRGRFCRSSGFFFHWPTELLASSSDTTGRTFRKSKTTLDRAPMVPEHEYRRRTRIGI